MTFKSGAALLATACLAFAALPAAASAATVFITDVQTGNGDFGDVSVSGHGTEWATPILLTDSKGHSYFTYCVDLDHLIYVGGGQNLAYVRAPLTENGHGDALLPAPAVSNEIGQIARIGQRAYKLGDVDGQVAAQAAIWQLAYGGVTIASDPTHPSLQADFAKDLSVTDNGRGPARALISLSGTQNQVLAVPEPATWVAMILGFGMIGAAARRRTAAARA